jgi:hypothetical protein
LFLLKIELGSIWIASPRGVREAHAPRTRRDAANPAGEDLQGAAVCCPPLGDLEIALP